MANVITLAEEMEEEVDSAKMYAKCYQKHKTEHPAIAKRYYEMATDEMKHAGYLHDMAQEKIKAMQDEKMTLNEFIDEMWEEKNDHYLEKVAMVKNMLSM